MSTDTFAVFYGIRRLIIDEKEIESLELRTHVLQKSAQKNRLKLWWGPNMDAHMKSDGHYLLMGGQIGIFGVENEKHLSLSDADLLALMEQTKSRLIAAGINEAPTLQFQAEIEQNS